MTPISFEPTSLSRTEPLMRPGDAAGARRSTQIERAPDRVELSDAARSAADDSSSMRLDLVRRIRAEIAAGTYETDSKVAIASHELAKAMRARG